MMGECTKVNDGLHLSFYDLMLIGKRLEVSEEHIATNMKLVAGHGSTVSCAHFDEPREDPAFINVEYVPMKHVVTHNAPHNRRVEAGRCPVCKQIYIQLSRVW